MALTPEQLEEVRKELAARMGNDSMYKNPRTEGAGFMGFGAKTDPILGNPSPSDSMPQPDGTQQIQAPEFQDAGQAARQGYQNASGRRGGVKAGDAMDIAKNFMPNKSFGQDTTLPDTSGGNVNFTDGNAPFGSTGSAEIGDNSFVGSQLDGSSGGSGGFDMGGGWMSAVAGALAGANQGHQNYLNDPKMQSKEDGFGNYHRDYRAELGGGTLGGVMGYFGGPVGAAFAGPAVKAAHPYGERLSRNMVREGDNVGGPFGAMIADPAAAIGSGKYSWGQLGEGALFGPAKKWFKF